MLHSLHSSSQHPQSVILWALGARGQEVSSRSSYRPSEGTLAATLLIDSSRHTNLHQQFEHQRSRQNEHLSKESGAQRVQRSLNFSPSVGSWADDSKRVISKLRQEISDLRKEAKDKSPAKERPRKRFVRSDREGLELSPSPSVHTEA